MWATEQLGPEPSSTPASASETTPGLQCRFSGEIPEPRVFSHTGWRELDLEWAYLHAGGWW